MSGLKEFTEAEIADLKAMAAGQSQIAVIAYNLRTEYEQNLLKLDAKMAELKEATKAKIEEMRKLADAPPSWKFDMAKRVFVASE